MKRFLTWTSALIVVATIALGVAYSVSELRTPAQLAAEVEQPAPSVVDVAARPGPLADQVDVNGTARRQLTAVETSSAPGGVDKAVITSMMVESGQEVNAGDMLAAVSGRPVIILSGEFPAFRDLEVGMSGPDVDQLRSALVDLGETQLSRTGTYNSAVADAVTDLYRNLEVDPPVLRAQPPETEDATPPEDADATPPLRHGQSLPASEVVFFDDLPAKVHRPLLAVGDEVSGPLIELSHGGWAIHIEQSLDLPRLLAMRDASSTVLAVDGHDDVVVEFAEPSSAPASPSDSSEAPSSGDPTQADNPNSANAGAAVLRVSGDTSGIKENARLTIRATTQVAPANSVIVPTSAIWTARDGVASVRVVRPGGEIVDTPVTVIASVNGETAVEAGAIAPDTSVRVLPVPRTDDTP